jgi:hypothetical protein
MLAAVNFDNDLFFETHKINDVRTDRFLSPEFETAQLSVAKILPHFPFGIRHIFSQHSGKTVHF